MQQKYDIICLRTDYVKGAEGMFKKIFSMVLVFLICCSTSITVFAQAEHSHVEENDASNGNEETAIINVTSPSPGIVVTDAEMIIASDCVQTATADSEYLEWLLGASDEIISASTIELLEYFLKSPFMGQQVYSCFSTPNNREIDFSCHEAFRELISREDCVESLESYAESILCGSKSDELDIAKFEKLLAQPSVESLISDSYPNLRSIYTASEVVSSSVGDLAGAINNIRYCSAGTISTANNRNVEVCTPHRKRSSSEITNINNSYDSIVHLDTLHPDAPAACHLNNLLRKSAEE